MEIAASRDDQTSLENRLQFIATLADHAGTEPIVLVRMWGRDHMCNAVGDCHFAHGLRDFEGFRAVVHSRKYVAMNIYHCQQNNLRQKRSQREGVSSSFPGY